MREYILATSSSSIVKIDPEEEAKELAEAGWPYALIKATQDEFDYALALKTGEVFFFRHARAQECLKWATIFPHKDFHDLQDLRSAFDLRANIVGIGKDRGLEINIDNIAWVTDAPFGS